MLDVVGPILGNHGYVVHRIDGKATLNSRIKAMRQFNDQASFSVMLASIGSCAEGYEAPSHTTNLILSC